MSQTPHCRLHMYRLVVASLLAASCSHPGDAFLAHVEQVAASCPADGSKVASLVVSDESGSRRGLTGQLLQQQVIRDVAERTAICGGHLRVMLFAGSIIGEPVFDGDLELTGATANARLRKAPDTVDAVMEQINAALPGASARLDGGSTDVVGQYQPAAEYIAQLTAAGAFHLELTILSDGMQTAGVDLNDPSLTEERATDIAARFPVPNLTGDNVRLVGIGRQADGAQLSSSYVAAIRAFHTAICERTGAACTVVTDAAGA